MKKMSANEIRKLWLDFFKSKGHHVEPSASLIPHNDPTLLWINAGVAALKKYFDGSEIPPSKRITNAQKSIRTNDIENVGKTARHHTFFEMLGNFSIGDYFRKEAIAFASELLFDEKWFGFPYEKIYITYHPSDLETKQYWMSHGVSEDHLIPKEDNFWEIGSGPCGPDTEMFFDRGEKYDPDHIGLKLLVDDIENDRYVEIWNIVFSQYNSEPGKDRSEYKELPSKNIDTGAGLERLACIIQETDSNFETDLFWPIIESVEKLSNKKYEDNKMAFRVIADHIRAITFALSDGEFFSNEGRGYVLRRLLRRAERYGKVLGINKPFLYELVDVVISIMKDYYPYLETKKDFIKKLIKGDEEKFLLTLSNGELLLKKSIEKSHTLSGDDMFKLYDTFGFPKELTLEICAENNVQVDTKRFEELMKEQKERARSARGDLQSMNKQSEDLLKFTKKSEFSYDLGVIKTHVIGLFKNGVQVDTLTDSGEIILEKTNFYAESGGQVSDIGLIENSDVALKVTKVIKAPNRQHLHSVEVLFGEIHVGDEVEVKIDLPRRYKIMRNHSSVHLLQEALTEVLGDHISQHGSFVNENYSHFDFNHFEKINDEQLNEIERKVNKWISDSIPCETKVLPIEEAKKMGAKALFNDKYGDVVRVVCFDNVSKEFCGGTHVSNSQDIGIFVIESEESVASGIRRITARTSYGAYELLKHRENVLNQAKKLVGVTSINDVNKRIEAVINEKDNYKKTNELLNAKLAKNKSESLKAEFVEIKGFNVLTKYLKSTSRNDLISLIDNLKNNVKDYIIAFVGEDNGSYPIVVSCSQAAIEKGNKAGDMVKTLAKSLLGSGGGRNEIASGSGKDISLLDSGFNALKENIHE